MRARSIPTSVRVTALVIPLALGAASLAPAASADPVQDDSRLEHLRSTNSNAPNVLPHVPPFGRKLV